jgi:ferric-dicitrate binding protein FerR (iron transport regulator)
MHLLAKKKKRKRAVRKLWGHDHHGRFRTHGRGAIATVRGTTWVVADHCDGTRTSVISGAVSVLDKRLHKTVLVHAGHSYFARTKR